MTTVSRAFRSFVVHRAAMPRHAPGAFESVSTPWSIAVSFSGHRRCTWSLGGRTIDGDVAPGSVQVVAHEPVGWHRVHEASRCVEVVPGPELLAELGGEAAFAARAERPPAADPVANALALRLARAVGGDDGIDELEAVWSATRARATSIGRSAGITVARRRQRASIEQERA